MHITQPTGYFLSIMEESGSIVCVVHMLLPLEKAKSGSRKCQQFALP